MADEKLTQADIDKAVKAATDKVTADFESRIEAIDAKKQEALDEAKKAKAELRKHKDISPEDVAEIEAERDRLTTELAEATKQVKALTGERDKAVKALEQESGFTQKLLIQDGLKSALIANGVKDEDFIDSLSAKFSAGAEVKIDGDKRVAMIGDKSLPDYVKEWAGTDSGKKFVSAPANNGGGAPGGKGGGGGGKTATQEQVDAMRPKERAGFFDEGGVIADA